MPKAISRASETKRKDTPRPSPKKRVRTMGREDAAAFNLASWLNRCSDMEGKNRVLKLMDLQREMKEHLQDPAIRKAGSIFEAAHTLPAKVKFNELWSELNDRLTRYSFNPRIWPPTDNTGHWLPMYSAAQGTDQYKYEAAIAKSLPAEPEIVRFMSSETDGVQCFLDAMRMGGLERVQRCGRCQIWFGRKFTHQTWCSSKCRIAEHRSSPEYREQRNKKAKEYYFLQRSGKVK